MYSHYHFTKRISLALDKVLHACICKEKEELFK